MARPFRGDECVEAALGALAAAQTVEQLKQAQAVILPLRHGLSLEETAEAIGHSRTWTSRLRNQFLAGEVLDARGKAVRGGRRHQNFTPEQEVELLKPFLKQAQEGGILVVAPIKAALEQALGRKMALSSVYNLLHRHNWRKLAPDKRHPKSDPVAQEAFKKTGPQPWRP